MKSIIKSVVTVVLLCSGAVIFAQEIENADVSEKIVLTVDEAVSYALENNKTLKSDAIDLEMQKRAGDNAWNVLLPTVGVNGNLARSNKIDSVKSTMKSGMMFPVFGEMVSKGMGAGDAYTTVKDSIDSMIDEKIKDSYGNEESALWHPVAGISVSWGFNVAVINQIKLAKKKYEAGQISYEKSVAELEINIRKLFYGLLLQQENLNIQKESLENAKARYEQASINYRNGLVPELQVLNSQVTYENLKPTVLSAEQGIRQKKDTFAFLLGLPFGKEIELSGKIDAIYVEVDADKLFKEYCDNNREIQNIKKQVEIAEEGLAALRFSTFTPSLAVSWGITGTVSNITKNWFDKDNTTDSGTLTFTLAYKNIIDMLPFSANMQKIKDTKQNIEKSRLGLEQLEQNTEIQVHTLVDNLHKSKANIEAMERNVELAKKAYASTMKAYNSGTQELLAVKDSESSMNQARLGLMNEKFNYISNLMDLEAKLNIKLIK